MSISSKATGLRPGVCTSTTRPSTPYTGMVIYETDTNKALSWNGSSWKLLNSVGTVPNFMVYLSGANGAATNGATIAYNTTQYDDLSNVSSGVFTVPSGQDGVYQLSVVANCYNIGTTGYFRVRMITTGSLANGYNGSQTPAQGSTDTFSTLSITVKMSAGDTAYCSWSVPATGNYSAGVGYNTFMGCRVR